MNRMFNDLSDLISRQDAIDAMHILTDSICEGMAIDALSELPSAEPCDNCIHDAEDWDSEACDGCVKPSAEADLSGYSDRLWKIAYERGKAEAQRKGKWIVCDAKPPTWWYECSLCGSAGNMNYNFCHNCGAKMEGSE